MNYKDAAKAMIDGAECIDKDGHIWRFEGGSFSYYNTLGDVRFVGYLREGYEPFTIKRQPVKYSVDVWLDRVPNSIPCHHVFCDSLLGDKVLWSHTKTSDHNKHYRITVEEVEE